ncbi:MAG: P-II family nitrogen regulator [Bacillota bacterium]|nr:P-II family nitrogen regulator [Bacillota bacterium]
MKEITAVIRMNMITKTKEALLKAGFPSFTCRKVVGRGKKKVDFSMIDEAISERVMLNTSIAEEISEMHRLVPKRMITILVNDEDAQEVIDIIIETNKTGHPGDGKIFVTNITDVLRVRTGDTNEAAL